MTNPNNASGLNASSAVAYIDGVEVESEYANGKITISDAVLTNGVHTIRMGICDNNGNYSEIKRQINVNADQKDNSVRVKPQDEDLIYMLNDSVYWVDVEVDAVETVKTVEMKLDLDSMNNWELEHIKTLYGFDCEYSFETAAEKAENILTIKFTRNNDYLSKTGTVVIASLPIRIWDYVRSDDHTHENAVAAWQCKYGCGPALSVDVDTEKGIVAYLDNTSHTFSSKDIHTLCVSYECLQQIRDFSNAFYTSHSYHVHTAVAIEDKAATCTEDGYTGRTWCETCDSPVAWGTTVPATGHTFAITDGILKCACGEVFSGVYTDGKTYADGVLVGGWVNDSYYSNGVMLTGVQLVDGYYYDFGENGICTGKVKYSGLFYDETVSAWRYALFGELASGWQQIGDNWHYFDVTTKAAVTGEHTIKGITHTFDQKGMTEGAWHVTEEGTRYYYGPSFYRARNENYETFVEIDGKKYNFDLDGYITVGTYALRPAAFIMIKHVYEFGEDGVLIGQITEQGTIVCDDDYLYYINENGEVPMNAGLVEWNGNYYYIDYEGHVLTNGSFTVYENKTNGLVPEGYYTFDEEGKMDIFRGVKDGYYYEYGKVKLNAGLVEVDGDIYLVLSSGKVLVDREIYLSATELLPAGKYYFGADGKLERTTGVKANGYYYVNGVIQPNAGLIELDGAYYFVTANGKVVMNQEKYLTEEETKGLLPAGTYKFGADGKIDLFTGVKDGYYYEYGMVKLNAGLVEVDGDIYLVLSSGKVLVDHEIYLSATELLPAGKYYFGADGKLDRYTGVKANGYYYVNGVIQPNAGLIELDGAYYFVIANGKVVMNQEKKLTEEETKGLLPAGTYKFGADGKIDLFTGVKDGYYYEYGMVKLNAGLVEVDGDIYLVLSSGKVLVDHEIYLSATELLPAGKYYFGADGKLDRYTGVKANGYYYVNGVIQPNAGLIELDGAYYFVIANGKVVMNQEKKLTEEETKGLFPAGTYKFGADGKMDLFTGVKDGYYYEYGMVKLNAGLVEVDGDIYLVLSSGKVLVDHEIYLSATELLPAGKYYFGADGKLDRYTGVKANGYYYVNGVIQPNAGLIELDGAYYFVIANGKVVMNQEKKLTEEETKGLFPAGTYKFGEDGKMDLFTGVKDGYYYEYGMVKLNAGLVKVGDDYYLVQYSGKVITNKRLYLAATEYLPAGNYTFGADGKMVI